MQTISPTLSQVLWPVNQVATPRYVRLLTLCLAGSALLAVSAKIQIPLPVPFTFQTMVVLMIGMAFGTKLAFATVACYLLEGALGLPVFAQGSGVAYMAGPTGGYLVGFLVAATTMGWLAERASWGKSFKSCIAAMLVGEIIIFSFGLLWLGYLLGVDKALSLGLIPFIPGEVVKIILAMVILPTSWRLAQQTSKQ